jgi:carbon-monoxide dehydrogenase large subunit
MAALRGAGRPEATALIERAMDLLAREVDMDPVELRRRNLLPPDAFPHTTAIGATYDTGDYEQALNRALSLAGYEELRNRQAERRSRGDVHQLGVGVSSYVELTGYGLTSEFGSVEIEPDGTAVVRSGISPQGQGHHTSMAQITAGLLHLPVDRVRVLSSDTAEVPKGEGTFFSRSLQVGGSAVLQAGEAVVEKARGLASHLLEVAVEDVVQLEDDRVGVRGVPDRSVTLAELAVAAHDPARLPEGMEPGLRADVDFDQGVPTYAFGSHVAVVDVDTETGRVRLLRHVAVDDCGRILNPMLAEGQVHGGLAMGIAQALFEEMTYDQSGNPLQANLMTYAMPSASDLPPFETDQTETPTTLNPLGAKGIGESATIGSTPAVQNAVVDALAHLSVRHIDMPLTSERVWRAIREARPAEPAPEPTPYPQATG